MTYSLAFITGKYLSDVDKILLMLAKRARYARLETARALRTNKFSENVATCNGIELEANNAFQIAKQLANTFPDVCPACFGDCERLHSDGLMYRCNVCNGTGKRP